MTRRFEKRWKNKIPEAYRDWSQEEISEAIDQMFDKLKNMSAENGYTFDDITACLKENEDLIKADEVMRKYNYKKSHRLF